MSRRQIVVTGYARLPGGIAARSLYEYLTLGALVDVGTHIVLRGTSTLATETGRQWVEDRMHGVSLMEDPPSFVHAVERDYWGSAGPALIKCYQEMVKRYRSRLDADGRAEQDTSHAER